MGQEHYRDPLDAAGGPLLRRKPTAEELAEQEKEAGAWLRQRQQGAGAEKLQSSVREKVSKVVAPEGKDWENFQHPHVLKD